jgi:hypothetical protein
MQPLLIFDSASLRVKRDGNVQGPHAVPIHCTRLGSRSAFQAGAMNWAPTDHPEGYWWRIGCSACGGGHPTRGTRSSGSLPPWPALRSAFSGNSPPVSGRMESRLAFSERKSGVGTEFGEGCACDFCKTQTSLLSGTTADERASPWMGRSRTQRTSFRWCGQWMIGRRLGGSER